MSIADIGPRPQAFNLEAETLENPNYRTVAWSGTYLPGPPRTRPTPTSPTLKSEEPLSARRDCS